MAFPTGVVHGGLSPPKGGLGLSLLGAVDCRRLLLPCACRKETSRLAEPPLHAGVSCVRAMFGLYHGAIGALALSHPKATALRYVRECRSHSR